MYAYFFKGLNYYKGVVVMKENYSYRRIAYSCPKYESILQAQGFGISLANMSSRPFGPRCDQCVHWNGGSCELFLAKGK
ncbi:MAG: hypothetical protein PWQ67_2133 [Clostridia bacterium]|jgi:hypothetical protein|nr:hypothetical protein [Clostridia bacterium]MDN5323679.1 hypothetical protein [Clostridia bacterium]